MKDRNNQGRGVSSFTAILGIFFDFSRLAWLSAEPVFVDRNRAYFRASQRVSSLRTKRVSAHTIRHTTAVHLLRAGVDINTIRAWLGHVSLDTTNVYAEVDLEMKAKALAHCEVFTSKQTPCWEKPKIMAFLKSI